jgi:predicted nucleic acid-binding protein
VSVVAFDTNILVYAELEPTRPKGQLASRLLTSLAGRSVLAAQVLGEFVTVVRKKLLGAAGLAARQADVYRNVIETIPTDADLIVLAAAFAERYRLQFWDALIWQASVKGRASILLTEDMQHGFSADGMRAVNPFTPSDWPTLAGDLGIVG